MEMGLVFKWKLNSRLPRDPPLYGLIDFIDNNFAGDLKDRKLFIRYYFSLNGAVVS